MRPRAGFSPAVDVYYADDPPTARGWDRLYARVLTAVRERGGVCMTAGELAEEADAWLP